MSFDPVTFAFELINFLVLAWLLTRYVLRPLATGIDERRAELERVRTETSERLQLVDHQRADLDKRSRELDTLREQVLADAGARAASERARILAEARQDAEAERARASSLLAAERVAALGWVRDAAVDRGTEVAGMMLLELVPEAAHAALLDRLLQALDERAEVLRGPPLPDEVEVTLPRVPDPELDRIREAVSAALGGSPRVTVLEDAALGAGAVVRIGEHVLDASVRGQLDLLRSDARGLLDASEAPGG